MTEDIVFGLTYFQGRDTSDKPADDKWTITLVLNWIVLSPYILLQKEQV